MHPIIDDSFARLFIEELCRGTHVQAALTQRGTTNPYRLETMVHRVFSEYLQAIADTADINPQTGKVIAAVYMQYNGDVAPGGKREQGILALAELLGASLQDSLHWLVRNSCAAPTEEQHDIIVRLTSLLERGYELAAQNVTLSDGNSAADEVIWTHTKFSDPERLLYIVSAHYLERSIYHYASSSTRLGELPKDLFLNALDDMIILHHYQHPDATDRLYDMWTMPAGQGGIGYINPRKILLYEHSIS